jgi:hypothetical protein
MSKRKKSLARMSVDAMQAAQDAAVTINARMPHLAHAVRRPAAPSAEVKRMVSEKAEAAVQGAIAASCAMGQLWTRAMFGGLRTPMDAMHGFAHVADAALHPARKRVRANAKRLSRRRR